MVTDRDSAFRQTLLVFIIVFTISIVFALYTQHAWEDWYITYRVSKNLATGNGMVYTPGERVHAFTSPLGTLVPALLTIATGNTSDDLVLWLYRVISCSLIGFAAVFLLRIAQKTKMGRFPTFLLVGLFAVDARIIDFSVNGQETALMMIFLCYNLYLFAVPENRLGVKLGMSWAGLMWTRPDGFIYFGALALGQLLFNPETSSGKSRVRLLKDYGVAAMVMLTLYLPWFLWTWSYYGSPIPHTIIAKGLFLPNPLLKMKNLFSVPFDELITQTSFSYTFMPPDYYFGGWWKPMVHISFFLAFASAFYWCLPSGRVIGRAVSFASFIAHLYLSFVAAYVAAWYVPMVTLMGIFVLGQISAQLTDYLKSSDIRSSDTAGILTRRVMNAFGIMLLLGSLLTTLAVGYEMKIQQHVIEDGHRKQIGLWLKEYFRDGERVFLECLGYIGYFSNLKMLDSPGLSSPEVVEARRQLQTDSPVSLVLYLKPELLVLRPFESFIIFKTGPPELMENYRLVGKFDVSDVLKSYDFIPGRPYLEYDQTFMIYRRTF